MVGHKIRVGLLFGGRSPEHEVSIATAASIAKEADPERIDLVPIYITRQGRWQQLHGSEPLAALAGQVVSDSEIDELERRDVVLDNTETASLVAIGSEGGSPEPIDVLFPALHGQGGEEGSVQGLARLADLPCVGAGILGSALGMDKIAMKQIAQSHKVPILHFIAFTRAYWERDPGAITEAIEAQLSPPVFIKPSNAGSSVGVTRVTDLDELASAVRAAGTYDYRILAEQGIDARELEVAVLGNDQPKASVVGEIIPAGEFYDYRGKYVDEGSEPAIPAAIPTVVSERVGKWAIRMFQALDLAGMARADFLLDRRDGRLYFNEVNTIPGFTPISMYPMLWEASGIPYRELITKLVELAIERHAATRVETRPPEVSGGG